MPKFKDNFTSKGFAFVEFASQKEAINSIELFNNCIPSEFTDITCQNFVHVQGTVSQLRVMPKNEWAAKKEEMKQIKREIAKLCPTTMFLQDSKQDGEDFLIGSILQVKYPALKGLGLTKVALQQALMHFGNPIYVDVSNVKQKDQEAIVRFASAECA